MNALSILTLFSMAVAAAMSVVVVRLVVRERRRASARVAALEADIYRTEDEDIVVLHDPPSPLRGAAPLFPQTRPRQSLPMVPVLAVGAAIALGVAVGAARYRASSDETAPPAPTAVAVQALELLSLDHERADDGLTVRGVIRNPPRGSEVDHLTAVVLVFNQQGGFLTSGRSPVESAALQPGTEAKFVVTLPGAADVGKYRVSFRTDDRVVPHVDRRW